MRTILVTGAASGIGYRIAEAFIQLGECVYVADLQQEAAAQSCVQLNAAEKGKAIPLYMDVTKEESVEQAFEKIKKEKESVDVIVNNAGLQFISPIEKFPLDKWRLLLDVMLTGTFLVTKHAIPLLKQSESGRIINISSVHGRIASPFKSAYISAKHGVVGFTKTAAIELAEHGITVNAIMPGAVDTPLVRKQLATLAEEDGTSIEEALQKHFLHKHLIKRFVQPEEVAQLAVFLASKHAGIITGESYGISGGW